MENMPSRDIYGHLKKKKLVRATKGIRKPSTCTFAKCHNQLLVAAAPDAKTCMRKFHGKLFWPCTTLVGKCRSRLAPGRCPGMHEISKASRQVQPYSLRAGTSLTLRLGVQVYRS